MNEQSPNDSQVRLLHPSACRRDSPNAILTPVSGAFGGLGSGAAFSRFSLHTEGTKLLALVCERFTKRVMQALRRDIYRQDQTSSSGFGDICFSIGRQTKQPTNIVPLQTRATP
jgi:hypothetical protein